MHPHTPEPTVVYYHDNCTDGFGAAFVIYKLLGRENVKYVACQYNNEPPLRAQYEGKRVIIVDFSFPVEVMKNIQQHASHMTWLDHHKTAFEAINQDPDVLYAVHNNNLDIILDTSRSGALLAFDWFFGRANSDSVPIMIQYIDDRDRWQFSMEKTRELHTAMQDAKPWSFEQWDHLDAMFYSDASSLSRFLARGETILEVERKQIGSAVSKGERCTVNGLSGIAVNATMHISEIGHALCKASGTYGLIYYIDGQATVVCSLRSEGDYDVSAIAKQFGGGGHKNAAGFKTDLATLGKFLTP